MTTDTAQTPRTSMPPRPSKAGGRFRWNVLALTSLAIAGYFVGQYAPATLDVLAKQHVGLASTYADHGPFILITFYVHIIASGLALALGPTQFSSTLRRRWPLLHRTVGRIYLITVGLGGVAAFIMSCFSSIGLLGFFGFGTLALLWMWTGWRAYRAIRSRDIPGHRAWMMRNFALTYAAVTLRTWLGLLIFAQLPFQAPGFDFQQVFAQAYSVVPFWCWLPNLVVAEWLIRRRGLPTVRLAPVAATIADAEM